MLDFISIILIFFLDSLPQSFSKGFLIMPYMTYLGYKRDRRLWIIIPILAILLSLYSTTPMIHFLFVIGDILFYYLYFNLFEYNFGNVLLISILQLLTWKIYIGELNNLMETSIYIVLYIFINLFYMRRATK